MGPACLRPVFQRLDLWALWWGIPPQGHQYRQHQNLHMPRSAQILKVQTEARSQLEAPPVLTFQCISAVFSMI